MPKKRKGAQHAPPEIQSLSNEKYNTENLKLVFSDDLSGKSFFSNGDFYFVLKETRRAQTFDMVAPAVEFIAKLDNPSTKQVSYHCRYQGKEFQIADVGDTDTIQKLTGKAVVKPTDFLILANYLTDQCEKKYFLTCTGWFNGKYRIPLLEDPEVVWQSDIPATDLLLSEPEKQIRLIKDALTEGKLLGMLYCCSLASMFPDSLPFAVFVTGQRGTGKTTACQLAVNLYGVPKTGTAQMFATSTGLELTLASCTDTSVLLDEALNSFEDSKVEQVLFMVTGGQTKRRGTKQVTTAPVTRIKVGLFSTSERLMDFQRGGSVRRMYAFSVADRTEITQLFEKQYDVNKALSYGGCIVKLTEFYIQNQDKFTRERAQKLAGQFGAPDVFAPAIDLVRAYMLYTAFFKQTFPKMEEYIQNFFAEISQELQKDYVSIFAETFPEWVLQNIAHFRIQIGDNTFDQNKVSPTYGLLKQSEENQYFPLVLSSIFGQFCKESEPQLERKALVRQLRAKNLLKTNSDEYYRMKGDNARYYYVLIPINLGAPESVSQTEKLVAIASLTGEADDIPQSALEDADDFGVDQMPF